MEPRYSRIGEHVRPTRIRWYWAAAGSLTLICLGLVQHIARGGSIPATGYPFGSLGAISKGEEAWVEYQEWDFAEGVHSNLRLDDLRSRFETEKLGCRSWTPELAVAVEDEDDRFDDCWRHKPYKQLHVYLQQEAKEKEYHLEFKWDVQKLERLAACYADIANELDCPDNLFRVLVGDYGFFKDGFRENPFPPGEVVWQRSLVNALVEQNFTLFGIRAYSSIAALYKQLPDVISLIWTDDVNHVTCQHDPRCVADMRSTLGTYPDFQMYNEDPMWGVPLVHSTERPRQKWLWTDAELDAIPQEERGTVPIWKLFSATVWGSYPGENAWRIPTEPVGEYSFSRLGPQWSVSSFRYPNHTYLPWSIEKTCMNAPAVTNEEKEDRFFVLAKTSNFFYEASAPKPSDWERIEADTGMLVVAAPRVAPEHPTPEGVVSLGKLGPLEFATELGKSRAMIGIGRPTISPSPYVALCQGTPVLIPYYYENPKSRWDMLKTGRWSQHGPLLLQSGPPYVYPYRAGNYTDLVRQMKRVIENPIERYIVPEQAWDAIKRRLDWYMWFDWQGLGTAVQAAQKNQSTIAHLMVAARCFDMGRCRPT